MVLFWTSSIPLPAASSSAANQDREIRERLIGTWQSDLPEKFFPLKRGYATYRDDGTFEALAVADLGGRSASMTIHGSWRIENGMLHERATTGATNIDHEEKSKIVSIDQRQFVQRNADGVLTMKRGKMPSNLPPVSRVLGTLYRSAQQFTASALATPKPEYPYGARLHNIEGKGLFRLVVNAKGTVESVTPWLRTGNAQLDEAATAALKQWWFKPGERREGLVPIDFKMSR